MTKRMFVCHANSAIESSSEVVDVLESALDFPEGTVLASSLPGYASATRSEPELRAVLAGTNLVLAVVTEDTLADAEFSFELGAAWSLGIEIIVVLLGNASASQLPWPLHSLTTVEVGAPDHWPRLAFEVATRLGIGPRVAAPAPEELPPPVVSDVAPTATAEAATEAYASAGEPEPAYATHNTYQAEPDYAAQATYVSPSVTANEASSYVEPVAQSDGASLPAASDAPPQAEITAATSSERTAYVSDVVPAPQADEGERRSSVTIAPVVRVSSELPNSDVFARLPTCESSFEVGRAVSDCAFNRAEITDFGLELGGTLGHFVDAVGGNWAELSAVRDLDAWLGATDDLLARLPATARRIADWYQLGFELATLHNLAGQLVFDSPDRADADEARWRSALDRFLLRAENAQIGYEELGRVLALLENLAGPRAQRDLANIGRSLAEVRRHAAGADGIHTAA